MRPALSARTESRHSRAERPSGAQLRRGSVLLVVLVIIVLLALGAYTFSETMISERQATAMYGRQVETRMLADSGVQYVAAMLGQRQLLVNESVVHNPDRFQGVLVKPADRLRGRGRFSVVAPLETDPYSRSIRFGIVDESGKLNLNAVARRVHEDRLNEIEARAILLGLPGMSPKTADAILDWLDSDEMLRKNGAESEYYTGLITPYRAKNGPLDTLDELILVRGVSRDLLFGEDTNRNGLLDANENDGDASAPNDNADDVLQRGWSEFLTILSREGNLRRDGRRKINVNQPSLNDLFNEVSAEFGDDIAALIVTHRLGGQDVRPEGGGDPSGNAAEAETRGGQMPSQPGSRRILSLYDLIGAELTTEETGAALESPWTTDPDDMREYLPVVLDTLTTHAGPFIEGRININAAPREVLLTVPGMTEALADVILASQSRQTADGATASVDASRSTTAWLLTEGHVDVAKMRQLDRYITARGDVYRTQVIGFFDAGETVTRLEAVIDATYQFPRVVFVQDLTDKGAGYSRRQITSEGSRR